MKKVLSYVLAFLFLYIIIVSFIKEKNIYENLSNNDSNIIQYKINSFLNENPNFTNVHSELITLENELTNRVVKRDKAKKDLEDLVNDEEENISEPPPGTEDIVNNIEKNSEVKLSNQDKDNFFNENKNVYNPF